MRLPTRLTLLACLAALAAGAGRVWGRGAGRRRAGARGSRAAARRRRLQRLHHPPAEPGIPPDDTYVEGPEPAPDETLYGIFIQVCNPSSDESHGTVEEFKIVDNQGNEFEPEELPEDNAFAYHARELEPKECIPEAGSVAQLGPTSGTMLLFRLPLQNTENRPLELEIEGEGDEHLTFELDI